MNPDVFFENFELLADAPNGVQKLRELILQLAVMGKLVPQDPNDEPASVLLEKIKVKKKDAKGEIEDKSKTSQILENEQLPLPLSWVLVSLGDLIYSIVGGGTPSKRNPEYWEGEIPWASVKDLGKGKYLEYTIDKITEAGIRQSSTNLIPKGRVIVCTRMGLGKIVINKIDVAINQDLKALHLIEEIDLNYFYNFYLTQNITGSGMTVKGIRQEELLNILVPLPSLAEQKRIVSKVDELMTLCDKLEARRQKKQEIQSKLNSAALDRMLSAENQEEFEQHWQRVCENFDLLYDNPDNVGKLKQAILQLAVQGKLVPQNPKDEPASVLIERIEAAKEKLVREGKSQKAKQLPEICLNELPYDLPDSWIWIRLGNVSNSLRYGTSKKCAYNITGSPVLRIPNIVNGKIDTSDLKFTQLSTKEIEDLRLDLGDLLLVRSNGSTSLVGRSAVINSNLSGYAYAGYLVRLRTFPSCISPDYLHLVLESSYVRDQIEMPIRTTSGVKNINSFEISRLLLSFPPLAEQKRIVEKVEQLMGLCDELEAKIRKERAGSEKLMEAVVKGLLEGATTGKTELEKPISLQVAAIQLK